MPVVVGRGHGSGQIGALGGVVALGMVMAATAAEVPRSIRLDELDVKCMSAGWGVAQRGRSVGGNSLRIGGEHYRHGIGTHAESRIVVTLAGSASVFMADVGIDDEVENDDADVEFVVEGDGKVLWKSGIMRRGDGAKKVRAGLAGVRELVLHVTDGGDGNGWDHANWADAVIVLTGPDPIAVCWESAEAVDDLKELCRLQRGESVLDAAGSFRKVRRIEGFYDRVDPDDAVLRPLLDSIAAAGALPDGVCPEPGAGPGTGSGRRKVWLDEFGALGVTCGWGSAQVNRSVEGNPLQVGGRTFKRGIGTHADSEMAIRLFGGAERFSAVVGVDDEQTAEAASVEFVVHGDGEVLWRSGVLGAADEGKRVDVDLGGVETLILTVTGTGDGIGNDHADWADAYLVVSGRAPEVIPPARDPAEKYTRVDWKRPLDRIALTWANVVEMKRPAEEMKKLPAADHYPGPVSPELERETVTVKVDLRTPFWHSTGLYAPPGERVTVTIPEKHVGWGLKIQVGCRTDELWHLETLLRSPRITKTYSLDKPRVVVANPFGGYIYVVVPASFKGKKLDIPLYWDTDSFQYSKPIVREPTIVKVRIAGAVRGPRFVRGVTSLRKWRKRIRKIEVPTAEIAGKYVVFQVPAAAVRDLDNPDEVIEFWDEVMMHQADLVGWGEPTAPMYASLDRQISVGGGHSGYPFMAYESWAGGFIDIEKVRKEGTWGAYHEFGHNHQGSDGWTFQDQGEVTVNLFSLYCNMKMSGWKIGITDIDPAPGWMRVTTRKFHLQALRKIYSRDPKVPGKWKEADYAEKLAFHVQLIDAFGWDPVKRVLASYRTNPDFPNSESGRAGEYMARFSRVVGRNLYPFFRGWGLEMPPDAEDGVKDLKVWFPDIVSEM